MKKLTILLAVVCTFMYAANNNNEAKASHPADKMKYYNDLKPNYQPGETGHNPNTVNPIKYKANRLDLLFSRYLNLVR